MSFAHVKREKVSFDSAAFMTYLAGDRTGEQAMWLKALLQWLDRRVQIATERWAEEHRARDECRAVAFRNDQVTSYNPWLNVRAGARESELRAELDQAHVEAREALKGARSGDPGAGPDQAGRRGPEGKGPRTPRLGRLAGAVNGPTGTRCLRCFVGSARVRAAACIVSRRFRIVHCFGGLERLGASRREGTRDIDLSGADLMRADLSEATLHGPTSAALYLNRPSSHGPTSAAPN